MKIKNLKLKNRIFLAPMLEPNDIAFRILCKKAGCGLTYTGMINPQSKQKLILKDKPALQIFCTSAKGLKKFIKKYEKKVSLFDFNLGCPSKNANRLKFGSFMHNNLKMIIEILKIIKSTTNKPITIKLRKSKNTSKIIKATEKYIDAIAIHPRTKTQGYAGIPDIKFAKEIKTITNLPIIYSGNANEKNFNKLLTEFDFIMIGRKAIGNPGIFGKMTNKKIKINFKNYLKLAKKYRLHFRQIKMQAMNFTHNLKNAKKLRRQIILAKNINDLKKIFKK